MKNIALVLCLSLMCSIAQASVLYVDDSVFLDNILDQVNTFQDFNSDLEFTILIKDTQVSALSRSGKKTSTITKMQKNRIKFYACEADLQASKIKNSALISGVSVVPVRQVNKDGKEEAPTKVYRFYKQFDNFCNGELK